MSRGSVGGDDGGSDSGSGSGNTTGSGRGFNNFGDKRLFEVEQTAVIEKGP